MEITVPNSKTGQLREGHVVFISRTRSERCPVSWTEKYLSTTGLNINPENYLVSRLAKTTKGHNAIGTIPVSYTRIRESFLELLSPLSCEGWDKHVYGLHSLRSGGASEAANHDVSDRLIGKHGRWASNTSRDTYIKDSKQRRLSITRKFGLSSALFATLFFTRNTNIHRILLFIYLYYIL